MNPEQWLPGARAGDRCGCMRVFLEGDGNVLSLDCGASYMNLYTCQKSKHTKKSVLLWVN